MSPSWLEVSLIVEAELVEPVSEVLARFAPDGVVVESTAVTAGPDDSEGHAIGPLRVAAYLPVDDMLEEKRQRLEESLWYLGRIRPLPAPAFQVIEQQDWSESWKVHYRPIRIGQRLVVVPAWLENPHPERIPIRIDPGMAFGTGTHPTTQLCLAIVEEYLGLDGRRQTADGDKRLPKTAVGGRRSAVIDLGCGTAILAIAALKLGAERALGVDIDPEAVQAAQENVAANGVSDRLELAVGSLEEVLAGKFGLRRGELVLANILAPVLVRLLGEGLADLVSPGGVLVLSGILAEQGGEVQAALEASGLKLIEQRQMGDWVALAGERPA
jgi:ribosomal protein L11 methyltransferase